MTNRGKLFLLLSDGTIHDIEIKLRTPFKLGHDELLQKASVVVNSLTFQNLECCQFLVEHRDGEGKILAVENVDLTDYI